MNYAHIAPIFAGTPTITIATLAYALYSFIVLVFLYCNLQEGEEGEGGWDLYRITGLLLCVVWPVMIVAVLVAKSRNKPLR